jgi:hypothetical protein
MSDGQVTNETLSDGPFVAEEARICALVKKAVR